MKRKFSKKLSPRAKNAIVKATGSELTYCLLQIAPSDNIEALRHELENMGGSIRSWSDETRLMTVEFESSRLEQLANLGGVIYVDAGGHYGA